MPKKNTTKTTTGTTENHKSFTLIELLVVISIISLLSSTILSSVSAARQGSRDARRMADLNQIRTALNLYYNDYGTFMNDGDVCANAPGGPSVNGDGYFNHSGNQDQSIANCLEQEGYTPGQMIDPSGARYLGDGDHFYKKETCSLGTYVYARLETEPVGDNVLPDNICGDYDEDYQMNYYLRVD